MRKLVDELVVYENQFDFLWRKEVGMNMFWIIVVVQNSLADNEEVNNYEFGFDAFSPTS
jgi:hypothetical protein